MKRLTLLAVALTMVLGMAASAFAAPEVTVSGNILVNAVWRDNWGFNDDEDDAPGGTENQFQIRQRLDLGFTAVANENLKAVIVFRSTREEFGQNGLEDGQGGAAGGGGTAGDDGVSLQLNQGYIDFNWPGTTVNVKAGFQPVALPAAVGGGSIIQDDNATGILASTALNDNVSLLAGWVRFADRNDGKDEAFADSQIDGWVVALPLAFEGVSATPFVVYADLSENAKNSLDNLTGLKSANLTAATAELEGAWWAGTSFELSMLDPFILKADVNYGTVQADDDDDERSGWLFDVAVEYTGFDFMNLELAYAYTSGIDDDDDNRMPVLSDSWALGTTWFGGGLITGDDMDNNNTTLGFHAVALSATGIQSFAEGLSHEAHIVYVWGNNDNDHALVDDQLVYGHTLMEDDTMLEIDFNTFYKIYDELTLYNGIGYVNLDLDDDSDTWKGNKNGDGGDAWKVQFGLKYVF